MDYDKTRKKYLLLFGLCAFPFISLFVLSLFAAIFEETSIFGYTLSAMDTFLLTLIMFLRAFWFVFVVCIMGLIFSFINLLRLSKKPQKWLIGFWTSDRINMLSSYLSLHIIACIPRIIPGFFIFSKEPLLLRQRSNGSFCMYGKLAH